MRAQVDALGEEPEDGPRGSEASANWWTYQHARNHLKTEYNNQANVFSSDQRETIGEARDLHRGRVMQLRQELYAALEPLKVAGYKIFREGSAPVDKSQFDLKSRV